MLSDGFYGTLPSLITPWDRLNLGTRQSHPSAIFSEIGYKRFLHCGLLIFLSRPKAGLRGLVPYLVSLNLSVTPPPFLRVES